MFFQKKKDDPNKNSIHTVAYAELLKRIVDLDAKVTLFTHRLEDLETNVSSLRGKFNARIKGLQQEEQAVQAKVEKEDPKPEKKDLTIGDYIAFG